jgi:RNA polymerase sporulation-specific sigma factor
MDKNESTPSFRMGDEEALVEQYGRLVRMYARPYFLAGGDSEDLIQDGMLGLLSAIRTFDPSCGVRFETYAGACIRNRIITAVKSAARFKNVPLNDYVPLESTRLEKDGPGAAYQRDPEELFIAREQASAATKSLYDSLSKFEAEVLGLYLEGFSYDEIAEKVNKSPKSVDNAVQRIRKKLMRCMENGESSES